MPIESAIQLGHNQWQCSWLVWTLHGLAWYRCALTISVVVLRTILPYTHAPSLGKQGRGTTHQRRSLKMMSLMKKTSRYTFLHLTSGWTETPLSMHTNWSKMKQILNLHVHIYWQWVTIEQTCDPFIITYDTTICHDMWPCHYHSVATQDINCDQVQLSSMTRPLSYI